jgi:hypothetical protein
MFDLASYTAQSEIPQNSISIECHCIWQVKHFDETVWVYQHLAPPKGQEPKHEYIRIVSP